MKAITKIVSFVLTIVTILSISSVAYASDASSNIALVKELLQNGNAETVVASAAEAAAIKNEVQAYIDAVTVASETPTVKAKIATKANTLKLSLVTETMEFSEEALKELSASAGTTVESIDAFIRGKLSYDKEAAKNAQTLSQSSSQLTAKGALSTGKAVCQGYSNLFALLTDQAGIETVKVRGYVDGGYHVMNVVRTSDGTLMAADVTSNVSSGNNWSLELSFNAYCAKIGFVPAIDVGMAFTVKYGA